MRHHIDLINSVLVEAQNTNEIFQQTRTALTRAWTSKKRLSYQTAQREIVTTLTKIAQQMQDDSHPITVLVDLYPDDPKPGRLTAHHGGAWMVINFERTLPDDWDKLSNEDITTVVFKVSQVFAHEMQHYAQYLRNWSYFEQRGGDAPESQVRSDAASACRELIAHYGDAKTVIGALKSSVADVIEASEAMAKNLRNTTKEASKRFLTALYTQLQTS
jgi:hypothetical protein